MFYDLDFTQVDDLGIGLLTPRDLFIFVSLGTWIFQVHTGISCQKHVEQ